MYVCMQIISGLRRFDIQYQGDPELQPIRSFENGTLVRLFYFLSCWINDQVTGENYIPTKHLSNGGKGVGLRVRFLSLICFSILSLVAPQLRGPMVALCSRSDLLGRLGRYYLTEGDGAARLAATPVVTRRHQNARQRQRQQPRLSLRRLASYRTLLALLLLYLLAALLLSVGPASSTALILAGSLLHGLFVVTLGDKLPK